METPKPFDSTDWIELDREPEDPRSCPTPDLDSPAETEPRFIAPRNAAEKLERATEWLSSVPGIAPGQQSDERTFRIAVTLLRGSRA